MPLTDEQLKEQLQYIADSPAPEYGGGRRFSSQAGKPLVYPTKSDAQDEIGYSGMRRSWRACPATLTVESER